MSLSNLRLDGNQMLFHIVAAKIEHEMLHPIAQTFFIVLHLLTFGELELFFGHLDCQIAHLDVVVMHKIGLGLKGAVGAFFHSFLQNLIQQIAAEREVVAAQIVVNELGNGELDDVAIAIVNIGEYNEVAIFDD